MGGRGASIGNLALINKINSYTEQQSQLGIAIMNPIPHIGEDSFKYFSSFSEEGAKIETVNLNDLYTTQKFIQKPKLIKMVEKSGIQNIGKTLGIEPIKLVYMNGKYAITDGNHRAVLALLNGNKMVKALVKRV